MLRQENITSLILSAEPKLIKFFDDAKVKNMLDYILIEPKDTSNRDESYKFPFVSQQILSSQASLVVDFFFPPQLSRKNSTGSMIYISSEENPEINIENKEKEDTKRIKEAEINNVQKSISNELASPPPP